jgi:multidrug efflux pump subunit AcrA (membrane-fusion protein)
MRAFRFACSGLLAFGVLVATSGCAESGGGARSAPVASVKVMRAERRDIATSLAFDGQIAPLLSATLSSSQSGNIVALYVNEGDRVRRGVLLAKIDDASLRDQLAQARGQELAARGKFGSSTLTQPIQSTEYDASVGQAQANVDADEAALRNAALLHESNDRLYPQGYVAQTTLEQSRSAYIAAQQQVSRDRAILRAARARLGQTQADLQSVQADRGAVEQARGLVRQLQTEIAQTEVRAPFDGVVTARLSDPGSYAGPNQPILTVSHLRTVYVDVNVPDSALAYVHPGSPVAFTCAGVPGTTFHGRIAEINEVPTQGTLSYRARMRYPNDKGSLRAGMLVSVAMKKEEHRGVIVVPRAAVMEGAAGASVFLVRAGKAVQVPVTIGMQTDVEAEIRGVKPGERVVTTPSAMLQNGSQVAIVDDAQGGK